MQKILIYAVSLAIVLYLGVQVYTLQSERAELRAEYNEVSEEYNELQDDSVRLQSEIEYISESHNLEKELRARFNYKFPYEKLIIVVPDEEEATSTQD